MKSKLTIDLDIDNQPIIKIEYNESEDVRDKMVKIFLESFGAYSCFSLFQYDDWREQDLMGKSVNRKAKIRPIKGSELSGYSEQFKGQADIWKNVTKATVSN